MTRQVRRRRRGSRRSTKQQSYNENNLVAFTPSPTPSRFVDNPYYPLTVQLSGVTKTSSGVTEFTVSNIVTAIQSQLGFAATYRMDIRFIKAKIWMSPTSEATVQKYGTYITPVQLLTDEWRISATPRNPTSVGATAYKEVQGTTAGPTSYPRVGFRWPAIVAATPVNGLTPAADTNIIFHVGYKCGLATSTTLDICSFKAQVYLLWRRTQVTEPSVAIRFKNDSMSLGNRPTEQTSTPSDKQGSDAPVESGRNWW